MVAVTERSAHEPVPFAAKSRLSSKIGREFVVSVEVNPPIGLDPSRAVAAARMLKEGGIDVINIADGARAQARMSNLVMAGRIQSEVGIETILHVCGRDRNLLGTLAHLLGERHGIKNLVIITGDPPKMGESRRDRFTIRPIRSQRSRRLNHGRSRGRAGR